MYITSFYLQDRKRMLQRFFYTNEKTDNRFFQYVLWRQPSDGIVLVNDYKDRLEIRCFLDARYGDRSPEIPVDELTERFKKPVNLSIVQRQREWLPQIQAAVHDSLLIESTLPFFVQQKLASELQIHVDKENRATQFRRQKTQFECVQIEQAQNLTLEVVDAVSRWIDSWDVVGMTERQLRGKMIALAMSMWAEGESFPAIVATWAHSAVPHRQSSNQTIEQWPLLIDCGYRVWGYCGDCTRVFRVGEKNELYDEWNSVVTHVKAAQAIGKEMITHWAAAKDISYAVRDYLKQDDLEKYFTHSLWHGVWLDVHESPRLSQYSDELLESWMAVTIEPGVYLPGKFGIRWEDVVEV